MESSTALISIHPEYALRILEGSKKLEFRRRWTNRSVSTLVIYATAPIKRIVGFAQVAGVTQGTPTELWRLTKRVDGGISKAKLLAYLGGSKKGVAIELRKIRALPGGIDPRMCLGSAFRPPQSFRYLNKEEVFRLTSAWRK